MAIPNPVPGGTFSNDWGAPRTGGRTHKGTDIFAPKGTPVLSPVSGVVVKVGFDRTGGNRIWIRGDDGRFYYFAHLDSIGVAGDQRVGAGATIGTVGNTGNATDTSPHLHFSINTAEEGVGPLGSTINPYNEIDPNLQITSTPGVTAQNAGAAVTTSPAAEPQGRLIKPPSDARLIAINGAIPVLLFDLGDGIYVRYTLGNIYGMDLTGLTVETMSTEEFNALGSVMGGDAAELAEIDGTYKEFFDRVLDEALGSSPARDDPGVRKVIADHAANQLGPEALANLLSKTDWFQSKSEKERKWNDATTSEEDREHLVADTMATLEEEYYRKVGQAPPPNQLLWWATLYASGQKSWGQMLDEWIEPQAESNPESPTMRARRAEEEAQRQRPNDVENKVEEVRDTFNRWGVPISDAEAERWARDIVEGRRSDADLTDSVRANAQTLYPWKDPNMETADAARPWLNLYERVMEKPSSGIFDPKIQKALNSGQPLYEFEAELKSSDEWLYTDNSKQTLAASAAEVGRRMGFM